MASGSGLNLWVWLAGGGCGRKEVYRFPHITYPFSFCICSFFQHPYFLFIFLIESIDYK